jgi:hypothetical protein
MLILVPRYGRDDDCARTSLGAKSRSPYVYSRLIRSIDLTEIARAMIEQVSECESSAVTEIHGRKERTNSVL